MKRITGLILGLIASLMVIMGIQMVTAPASQAYCLNYGSTPCYVVHGFDDAGDFDPPWYVKGPNPWSETDRLMYDIDPDWHYFIYSSEGRWNDPWATPQKGVYSYSYNNDPASGVTGIRLPYTSIPGKIMCKSGDNDQWPGTSWTKVSHDDGSWRYFPSANAVWHLLDCKAVVR